MSSLVANLNGSASQKIVNWATTADGCVHSAPTRLNSTVESRRRCVSGVTFLMRSSVVDNRCYSDVQSGIFLNHAEFLRYSGKLFRAVTAKQRVVNDFSLSSGRF